MSFASLGLPSSLTKVLQAQNFEVPYPIQEKAIPTILSGKDLLGIAQTGSGKTASFVLPILANLKPPRVINSRHTDVLVLVPTRELAVQVDAVFQNFAKALSFPCKCMSVYGGPSINVQMKALANVRVLVATPGRLLDLVASKTLHLSKVSTLVLDEADKMLNLGFKKELDEILELLPKERQNLLFSATLSSRVEDVQRLLLHDPTIINIEVKEDQIELIHQEAYALSPEQKGPLLRKLIEDKTMKQVLIFTSSIHQADVVALKLRHNNFDAIAIHSKKSQHARTDALADFKSGKLRILVTTDLLARGIDIQFLPFVINYELPRSPKDFIHRIGRTGRAEQVGEALTFVTPEDEHHFKVIQKKMKKRVPFIEFTL
jgi:ATP-dependent RNA helicase RhlE